MVFLILEIAVRPMTLIVLAVLLLQPASVVLADESPQSRIAALDETTQAFAATCMSHFFSKEDIHAKLGGSSAAVKYDAGQAEPFLRGQPGEAWGVRGEGNNFVVVLIDRSLCSVNAERLSTGVSEDFHSLLQILFPGTELVPVEAALAGPTTDLVTSVGYRLKRGDQLLPPIFTLVVSRDPRLNFGARLTLWFPEAR